MVMKKSFLVILFLSSIFKLYSQDAPYSWKIKLGVNLVNIQDKNILSEILNSKPIPPNAVSETSNEGKIPFFSTPS